MAFGQFWFENWLVYYLGKNVGAVIIVWVLMVFICCSREEFMHWVEMLPDTQTPSWLGLPSNAEKVLLTTQGMPQPRLSHLYSVPGPNDHHNPAFKVSRVTPVCHH